MNLPLDTLDLLESSAGTETGVPLQLPVDAIDEDPDQPRREFDAGGLAELAETIRERGVRQPISVRRHPEQPGRWVLNFGARRLRASKLAGKIEIPAFVDATADSYDQVIENEQREALKPLELALFIQRQTAKGESPAQIARCMGKSRQYVMVASALIDAPDWLMNAYREGRCRGLNELHELRRLHASHPQYVEAWASDRDGITRERLQELRAGLAGEDGGVRAVVSAVMQAGPQPEPRPHGVHPPALAGQGGAATRRAPQNPNPSPPAAREGADGRAGQAESCSATRPALRIRAELLARLDDAVVRVVVDDVPDDPESVYIRVENDEARQAVKASRLRLLGFGRG